MALSVRHHEAPPSREIRVGPFPLIAGALLAIAGLWAPWYRLNLPDGFLSGLSQEVPADNDSIFLMFMAGLEEAERAGRLRADAWEILSHADIAITALACIALLAVGATILGHLDRFPAGVVTAAGAAVAGIALYRAINPPDPVGMLETMWGPWVTVAGGALIVAGSRLAFRD